jgi:hypothetical protein
MPIFNIQKYKIFLPYNELVLLNRSAHILSTDGVTINGVWIGNYIQ